MTKRITKTEILENIKRNAQNGATYDTVTAEDVIAYVDTTLEQIKNKAAKAKERAAQKKAEGDDLRDAVYATLTEDYQTIADIAAQIDNPEVTKAKISARLTQLREAGMAHKVEARIDGRKVMTYAVGPAPEDAE